MLARWSARFDALVARFPWLTSALAWSIYAVGVVWRWFHVVKDHDPRDHVYSDMEIYVGLAKRLADPGYHLSISDVTHPPGVTTLLASIYARDPSLQTAVYVQFVVCALAPLVIGGLGRFAFGKGNGKAALAVASLYFPFVDYGGYFLAEIYMILTMPLWVMLLLVASRQGKIGLMLLLGALAGFVFSVAMALKALALPALLCFLLVYFVFWHGPPRKRRALVVAALAIGSLPLVVWQCARCTTANNGKFCPGSNKAASDFLMGHYGRFNMMTWHDPVTGETRMFGSPSTAQHGYTERPEMDFGITDSKKNIETALGWIRQHPIQTITLTGEHIYDLYFGSVAWPSSATRYWVGAAQANYAFVLLMLLPASVRCIDLLRIRGLRGFLGSTEALVLSPVVGLIVSAAIATGEPRYRIPFDSLYMVVALEFFADWKRAKKSSPATTPLDDEPSGLLGDPSRSRL